MTTKKQRADTTTDWLKQRKASIGSSDAGAVVGLNKYKSNVDVYLEKITDDVEDTQTIDTRLGTKMEQPIAELFSEDSGLTLEDDPYIRFHPDYPFLSCNLDRIITEEGVPAEIKMKSRFDGDIPDYEFCQIQQQMAITDAPYIYYIVLVTGFNRRIEHQIFERNDPFIQQMIEREQEFWEHVQQRIPPEPHTYADAKNLFSETTDIITQASESDYALVREAAMTHEGIKLLEAHYDQLKAQIGYLMQDSEVLQYGEDEIVTWKKTNPRKHFNKKQFKKDHPELYREYVEHKPGYRRMLLKKNNLALPEDVDLKALAAEASDE